MRDREQAAADQARQSAALCGALADQADVMVRIAGVVARALRKGKKVLLLGNGGSAADAEHIAGELSGKFTLLREPLPAIALTANTASLTAIANDFGVKI